jgi:hypothetical protein
MCYQWSYGMPTLWPIYKIMVFKKIEKNHLLQELALIAKDPSLLVNQSDFNGEI